MATVNKKFYAIILLVLAMRISGGTCDACAKKCNPLIEWGTYDTSVTNRQTLFFWIKVTNDCDSAEFVSKQGKSVVRFSATLGDEKLDIGYIDVGDVRIGRNNAIFTISGIRIWRALRTKTHLPALARWNVESDFSDRIISQNTSLKILPPDNMNLEKFFDLVDDYVTPKRRDLSGKISSMNSRAACNYFSNYLDSLKRNGLANGISLPTAEMTIAGWGCSGKSRFDVGDESTVTWPHYREANRCLALARSTGKDPDTFCAYVKLEQNALTERILKFDRILPSPKGAPYKFLKNGDTIAVNYGTWFGDVEKNKH